MWSDVGIYTVTLLVEDGEDQSDTDSIEVYTATMGYSIADWYVPVNDDDDDGNGRMDNKNDVENNVAVSGDDDLVSVSLSVTPPDCYNVVTLSVTQDPGALQVWDDTLNHLLINPFTLDTYEEWDVGGESWAMTVYMDGLRASAGLMLYDPYLHWYFHGWGIFSLSGWNGKPPSKKWITVVHVDMDLGVDTPEEVKDNDDRWPGITEETTPGGFIPEGDFVPLTVRQVNPPLVEDEDPQTWPELTLSVEGASSKIEIWNTGKTAFANLNEPLTPPSGGTILWVKGVAPSSSLRDITLVLTHGTTGFKDKIKLTVYGVNVVEWETYPDDVFVPPPGVDHGGNLPLDTCPPPNGGKRIFPGKKDLNDTVEETGMRKKVRVKATLSPVIPDKKIYFKSFDVDDPSSNTPPIDPLGAVGNDNHNGSGSLLSTSAWTNGSGEARVTFTVGMAPGDNYRVAASLDSNKLLDPYLTQAMADADTPPLGVRFSPMLTVWRKLWVERDYMAPVAQTGPERNKVVGTATSLTYDPATNGTTIDLGLNLPDAFDDENQFGHGRYVTGGVTYEVKHSTAYLLANDTVLVVGHPGPGAYELYDDDDQTLLNSPFYCSVVAAPFAAAYIEINYLPVTYSQQVPFNLNLTAFEMVAGTDYMNQKSVTSSEDFWACLIVACYQGETSRDWDPAFEPIVDMGAHHHGETCVIFRETYRDCPSWSEAGWGTHEVGHTGGRAECSTNPCYLNGMSTNTPTGFCDQCIHFFRSHTTWSSSN